MLRGVEASRPRSGGPRRQRNAGLGAVVPVPLTPGQNRRAGGGAFRLLGAAVLLGVLGAGAMLAAHQAATADCTALALDRDTKQTVAVPCTRAAPSLPSTLTALLRTGLPDAAAATPSP